MEAASGKAGKAVMHASNRRIHTFIATNKINIDKKLRRSETEVLERAEMEVK